MFRELVRKNKKLTKDECIKILTEEKRGVLLNCTQFFGHFMLSYLYIELQLEFDNKEHLNLFHN